MLCHEAPSSDVRNSPLKKSQKSHVFLSRTATLLFSAHAGAARLVPPTVYHGVEEPLL